LFEDKNMLKSRQNMIYKIIDRLVDISIDLLAVRMFISIDWVFPVVSSASGLNVITTRQVSKVDSLGWSVDDVQCLLTETGGIDALPSVADENRNEAEIRAENKKLRMQIVEVS